MKHLIHCEPSTKGFSPLDLVWDDETLELAGKDAADILEMSKDEGIVSHPHPTYYEFEGGASDGVHIKKSTLALIVSQYHHVPEFLADAMPEYETEFTDEYLAELAAQGIFVCF